MNHDGLVEDFIRMLNGIERHHTEVLKLIENTEQFKRVKPQKKYFLEEVLKTRFSKSEVEKLRTSIDKKYKLEVVRAEGSSIEDSSIAETQSLPKFEYIVRDKKIIPTSEKVDPTTQKKTEESPEPLFALSNEEHEAELATETTTEKSSESLGLSNIENVSDIASSSLSDKVMVDVLAEEDEEELDEDIIYKRSISRKPYQELQPIQIYGPDQTKEIWNSIKESAPAGMGNLFVNLRLLYVGLEELNVPMSKELISDLPKLKEKVKSLCDFNVTQATEYQNHVNNFFWLSKLARYAGLAHTMNKGHQLHSSCPKQRLAHDEYYFSEVETDLAVVTEMKMSTKLSMMRDGWHSHPDAARVLVTIIAAFTDHPVSRSAKYGILILNTEVAILQVLYVPTLATLFSLTVQLFEMKNQASQGEASDFSKLFDLAAKIFCSAKTKPIVVKQQDISWSFHEIRVLSTNNNWKSLKDISVKETTTLPAFNIEKRPEDEDHRRPHSHDRNPGPSDSSRSNPSSKGRRSAPPGDESNKENSGTTYQKQQATLARSPLQPVGCAKFSKEKIAKLRQQGLFVSLTGEVFRMRAGKKEVVSLKQQ